MKDKNILLINFIFGGIVFLLGTLMGFKSLTELDDLLDILNPYFGMDTDTIIAADTEKMMWERKFKLLNL